MSNSETNEASVPIVDVESSSSVSTLVNRMSEDSSTTSSEERVGTSSDNALLMQHGVLWCQVSEL